MITTKSPPQTRSWTLFSVFLGGMVVGALLTQNLQVTRTQTGHAPSSFPSDRLPGHIKAPNLHANSPEEAISAEQSDRTFTEATLSPATTSQRPKGVSENSLLLLHNALVWPTREWRDTVSEIHNQAVPFVNFAWNSVFSTLSQTPLPLFLRTLFYDCLKLRIHQFTEVLPMQLYYKWDLLSCSLALDFLDKLTGVDTQTPKVSFHPDDYPEDGDHRCYWVQRKHKVIAGVTFGTAGHSDQMIWNSHGCNDKSMFFFPGVTQSLLDQYWTLLSLIKPIFPYLFSLSRARNSYLTPDTSKFDLLNLPDADPTSIDRLLAPRQEDARADSGPLVGALVLMSNTSLVFTGLMHNLERFMPILRMQTEYLGLFFHKYATLFFENDSRDQTVAALKAWKEQNSNVHYISKSYGRGHSSNHGLKGVVPDGPNAGKRTRLVWLATYRNEYLTGLRNDTTFASFNYTLMMDTDIPGFAFSSVVNSFAWRDWDLMCSNGRLPDINKLRDAFAYRDDKFPESPFNMGSDYAAQKWKPLFDYGEDHGDVRLKPRSCFGGMALYNLSTIRAHPDCSYDGADCEHVPFHNCLRSHGAKLFMNPGMHHIVW